MKRILSFLDKIDAGVATAETAVLITITLVLVVAAFIQVVLRNFFNSAIEGGDIMLRHFVLWIGFIGASLATRDRKHISIDVLTRLSPSWLRSVFRVITGLFAAAISLILAYAAWEFVMSELDYKTMLFGSVKAWYFEIIMPIGFLFIGLRFLLGIVLTPPESPKEKISP